ncbi:hypothetical protein ACFQ1I_00920 [Kitasatospora arboriphila]
MQRAAHLAARRPGAHPCAYFRSWGTYHAYDYDYDADGPPPDASIVQPSHYTGRMTPLPEPLSGCRKAPILAVGINPNLPGWWPDGHGSLTPDFDSVRQYAHYFRHRGVFKPELPDDAYRAFGGGPDDTPWRGSRSPSPRTRRAAARSRSANSRSACTSPTRNCWTPSAPNWASTRARSPSARTCRTATWSPAPRPSGPPGPTRTSPPFHR